MTRRATFILSSIACFCLVGANSLQAGTTTSSDDAAVRQLKQFKTLLSVEVARGANDPTLPGYFRKVAGAFRKVGYPGIGHVLELSGASSLQSLAGQFTGHITSLNDANNFMARLESAIGIAKSANAPTRLDYLISAQKFLHGFYSVVNDLETRRANEAAAHWKGTSGSDFSTSPNFTVGSTTFVQSVTSYTPPASSSSGNTAATTVSAGSLTLVETSNTTLSYATTSSYSQYFYGAIVVSAASPQVWSNTTIEASSTLTISSGAFISFYSGSTFKLLGTLSVDLASSVVPINGNSTTTYDLEAGATLNVKNPALGTFTILSGFQSTGNTLGDVTITGLATGQTGTLSQANGTVTLTITGASSTP